MIKVGCYIGMDVGGTQIKSGIVLPNGKLYSKLLYRGACAKESREVILSNLLEAFRETAESLPAEKGKIAGLGMAFPGDFDYVNGICLMHGVDKYDAIYQVNLKNELEKRIQGDSFLRGRCAEGFEILFLHDIAAFLLGEIESGIPYADGKIMTLCIGTGAGSSFAKRGKILSGGSDGVPHNGWIYSTPFRNSMIDDYISVRGLAQTAKEYTGKEMNGKELFDFAEAGDETAREAFLKFGERTAEAIYPFLSVFRPNLLILGGQIAKSWQYFGAPIEQSCAEFQTEIHIELDTSEKAILGLFRNYQQSGNENHNKI